MRPELLGKYAWGMRRGDQSLQRSTSSSPGEPRQNSGPRCRRCADHNGVSVLLSTLRSAESLPRVRRLWSYAGFCARAWKIRGSFSTWRRARDLLADTYIRRLASPVLEALVSAHPLFTPHHLPPSSPLQSRATRATLWAATSSRMARHSLPSTIRNRSMGCRRSLRR